MFPLFVDKKRVSLNTLINMNDSKLCSYISFSLSYANRLEIKYKNCLWKYY